MSAESDAKEVKRLALKPARGGPDRDNRIRSLRRTVRSLLRTESSVDAKGRLKLGGVKPIDDFKTWRPRGRSIDYREVYESPRCGFFVIAKAGQ
jgi:hypothetical protein